ncbi:MAG: caspase family protein [Bacteroidota bacterium]
MDEKRILIIIFSLLVNIGFSQREIIGTIYDDTGSELAGATVRQKGTSQITHSDQSGDFKLETQARISTYLEISHQNYKTLIIDATAFSSVKVRLVKHSVHKKYKGHLTDFDLLDMLNYSINPEFTYPVYDAKSQRLILNSDSLVLSLKNKEVINPDIIKISKDNKFLALSYWGYLELWNLETGILILREDHAQLYSELETDTDDRLGFNFSKAGDKLLVGCKGCTKIREFDARTGKIERLFSIDLRGKSYGETKDSHSTFYPRHSPNGKHVVAVNEEGEVLVWDYSTTKMIGLKSFGFDGNPENIMNSTMLSQYDGKLYCLTDENNIESINPSNLKFDANHLDNYFFNYEEEYIINTGSPSILFSRPHGNIAFAAANSNRIQTWEDEQYELKFSLSGHDSKISTYAVSQDGYQIASADENGNIKIWNTSHLEHWQSFNAFNSYVDYLAFSPDNDRLLSVTRNGFQIWDVEARSLLVSMVYFREKDDWSSEIQYCFFRPDGTFDVSPPLQSSILNTKAENSPSQKKSQYVPGLLGSIFGSRALLSVQQPIFSSISGTRTAGNPFVLKASINNLGKQNATINRIRILLPSDVNGLSATEISDLIVNRQEQTEVTFNFFVQKNYQEQRIPITIEIWGNGGYYFRQTYSFELEEISTITTELSASTNKKQNSLPNRRQMDHALFFAVDNYQSSTFNNLKYPIKNAKEIAAALRKNYGFSTSVVPNPTAKQIEDSLRYYQERYSTQALNPEGQLLIFFSGHGEVEYDIGYFLPTDTDANRLRTAIDYPFLQSFINNIPCKHILVVIDACYSGSFDPEIAMRSGVNRFRRPNELSEPEKFYDNHLNRRTRLFMSSSAKERTPDKSDFAKKILDGLRREAGKNYLLTVGELFETYVKKANPTPLLRSFGKDEAGSSFILIAK